ncbi:hypothetical protein EJB05_17891, partial [Eragrostis curvula]
MAAWWRNRHSYVACSGLRRSVLHGSGWLAGDIVGDDGACDVATCRLSPGFWWCGVGLVDPFRMVTEKSEIKPTVAIEAPFLSTKN